MHAKLILAAAALFGLAACGELNADLERAKQGAVELGQETLNAGAEVLDTRSACLLAGQSVSFCGCLSERLGPDLTAEHVEVLTDMVRASVSSEAPAGAEERTESQSLESPSLESQSREAIVACATRAVIEGAATQGPN
jgi:hypothetical protein